MFRRIAFFVVAFVVLSSACTPKPQLPPGTKAVLEAANDLELLSLDPMPLERVADSEIDSEPLETETAETEPVESLHGFRVLGSTQVEDPTLRYNLLTSFEQGFEDHDGSVAACFNPRHALRMTVDEKLHEFVICFECRQVKHYVDGAVTENLLISNSPATTFNEALREAGVPLTDN